MKIYLVGGAVRDQLLGYPIKERDWLVVGATVGAMLEQGYKKVGKDFPVFLHPTSQEEYALARTERKNGVGYYGFGCDFNPSIKLEEDLSRRDLTINSMAQDLAGNLIDPYNGQKDLEDKLLRHVSIAFIEDPVRVLRIARFAARYHHLGFKVAPETLLLMKEMVRKGELDHLVKERIWQEWRRSLDEKNPEIFICVLRSCGALKILLPELDSLFGVPSSTHYHPEIDTGVHTLMVLRETSLLSQEPIIRFAATLHDLGKGCVSMLNWPKQTGHGELGVPVILQLCKRLRVPVKFRQFAILVSRLHINIHMLGEITASEVVDTLEVADAFRRPEIFEKLLTVSKADSFGRGLDGDFPDIPWFFPKSTHKNISNNKKVVVNEYKQEKYWRTILADCNKIKSDAVISAGFNGKQIKLEIRKRRVNCVETIKQHWEFHER
jgi:tRNA nucleotidyltransferase (CCA-adding enzyme)